MNMQANSCFHFA